MNWFQKVGWKYILVGFVCFLIGLASSSCPEPKTVEVTKMKEVCTQEATWRQLKEIDDKGFSLAAEQFGLSSDALSAIMSLDYDRADQIADQMQQKVNETNAMADQRAEILKELGY